MSNLDGAEKIQFNLHSNHRGLNQKEVELNLYSIFHFNI